MHVPPVYDLSMWHCPSCSKPLEAGRLAELRSQAGKWFWWPRRRDVLEPIGCSECRADLVLDRKALMRALLQSLPVALLPMLVVANEGWRGVVPVIGVALMVWRLWFRRAALNHVRVLDPGPGPAAPPETSSA